MFKFPQTPLEKLKLETHFNLKLDFGFPAIGGAFVITPGRLRQSGKNVAASVRLIDDREIPAIPSATLAGALASAPAYGAYRPNHLASPGLFDAGIALRGVSALALRDGVPLTDPFGGWVPWADLPQTGLARVEFVPGGGATVWGSGASGGAVQFLTLPARGKIVIEPFDPQDGGPPMTKQVIHPTGQLTARIGNFDTLGVEFVTSQPTSRGVLQILGRGFRTDGFPLLMPPQRGPIDRAAWNRHHRLEARWRQSLGKDRELVANIRSYDETSGNGTPYQQGGSQGTFASVTIASNRAPSFAWNALAYAQSGTSTNRFSAVSTDRTQETPIIDRFAVPTHAFGASWTGIWRHFGSSRTNAGLDLSRVQGETRENLHFANGASTHRLVAGGNQSSIGAFVSHDRTISQTLRATAGARIDAWSETQGHHHETESVSQAVVLDQHYGRVAETELSPSLGIVWQPHRSWRWRAYGQHAFRRPTLGERYQMAGRYNVVTAANPALRTEHNTGIEIAAEYLFLQKAGSPLATLEARAFLNDLRDTVGTAPIARGSGELPHLASLPTSYRGEKRINLDRTRLQGFELAATWQPDPRLLIEANLRLSDSAILHSAAVPGLEGKRLVETPHRTAALSAKWKISKDTSVRVRVRSIGRQFADNENTLPLDGVAIADLGASHQVNQHLEFYLIAENLTDSRIETDRSTDDLIHIGSPRLVLTGVRLNW